MLGQQSSTASTLESRIRDSYRTLPASERKIGDLIMEFPGQVASYSATELAALAGASKAAVTRFCHRLGYADFHALRRAARDGQEAGSPLYLLTGERPSGGFSGQLQRHLREDVELITKAMERLDGERYGEIVAAICQARGIYIAGWRNSHYLAGYLRWQLIQTCANVFLVPGDGETLAERMASLSEQDLVIVIGFRRRVAMVHQTIDLAAGLGAKVLYLTDTGNQSPTEADWTLCCPIRGTDALDRYAGVMSMLHFLAMGVMEKMGAKGRARLARIEQLHGRYDDFA